MALSALALMFHAFLVIDMKRILFSAAFILFAAGISLQFTTADKLFVFESGSIHFFSETPVENIEAETKAFAAALKPATRQFAFSVQIAGFEFEKKLMQEHFNENYLESEKYPKATFAGTIVEDIDLLKEGKYTFSAKGKLNIHGVEQERTISVNVENKGGKLHYNSNFQVKLVDHNIEVPSIVVANIAEIIDVKVQGVLKEKE